MSEASVDEYQVGPHFSALHGILVPAFDHLGDHRVIVYAFYGLYLESPVAAFEGFAVDEFYKRADRLGAADIGNVDAFDDANRVGALNYVAQLCQGQGRGGGKGFRLEIFVLR